MGSTKVNTIFLHNYRIQSWVCLCWSLVGARTLSSVVAACNLASSRHRSLTSSVDLPQARQLYNLTTDFLLLDYRRYLFVHVKFCIPSFRAISVHIYAVMLKQINIEILFLIEKIWHQTKIRCFKERHNEKLHKVLILLFKGPSSGLKRKEGVEGALKNNSKMQIHVINVGDLGDFCFCVGQILVIKVITTEGEA